MPILCLASPDPFPRVPYVSRLHGSYESLKGGTTCEAMEDFSGGVTEMYDIDKAPDNLFQILLKADERKSLMGCSIEVSAPLSFGRQWTVLRGLGSFFFLENEVFIASRLLFGLFHSYAPFLP